MPRSELRVSSGFIWLEKPAVGSSPARFGYRAEDCAMQLLRKNKPCRPMPARDRMTQGMFGVAVPPDHQRPAGPVPRPDRNGPITRVVRYLRSAEAVLRGPYGGRINCHLDPPRVLAACTEPRHGAGPTAPNDAGVEPKISFKLTHYRAVGGVSI